MIFIMNNLL